MGQAQGMSNDACEVYYSIKARGRRPTLRDSII